MLSKPILVPSVCADADAHNRLKCGVHYPSDIVASKLLAYRSDAVMQTNP